MSALMLFPINQVGKNGYLIPLVSQTSSIRHILEAPTPPEFMIDIKMFGRTNKYKKLTQVKNNTDLNENNNGRRILNLKTLRNRKSVLTNSSIFDAKTESSNWFCPNMERTQATSILSSSSIGSFRVRSSINQESSFFLSVRVPGHLVEHHLLQVVRHDHYIEGVAVLGSEKVFPSIYSLVTHLSIMRESLPCTLALHTYDSDASDDTDDDDDEDIIDIDSEPELEEIIKNLQKQMMCK